ncbi:MAG: hypothetical protein IT306_06740 [Chloroflexi bacterium]|nr:hypothetical protein [Chloroflexota bacterium]
MAERSLFLVLDNLSPLTALQILAGAAVGLRAARLDPTPLLEVRVSIEVLGAIASATLLAPVAEGRGAAPGRQQATDALLRAYSERVGNILPSPRGISTDDTCPLAEGLARLLLQPSDDPVPPEPSECLLVAEGIDGERAAQILEDAAFDATSVRTLVAETRGDRWPSPAGGRGGLEDAGVFLFHIRDDRGRRSTFQGALAGEWFADCVQLACFDAGGGAKVFLPAALAPGRAELAAFREVVRALPLTSGAGPVTAVGPAAPMTTAAPPPAGARPDRDERLVAVYPGGPDTARFAVAYLAGLQFRDRVDLEPRRRAGAFEVVDLRSSPAIANRLRDVIERSGAGIGYRLELRPTDYAEPPEEGELARLDQEIFDLELRRAALRSITLQKPVLYRFSQQQLAGLADVLRAYPPRVLAEGHLQYAFQPAAGARGGEPVPGERSGLHYLLVDPSLTGAMTEKLRFPEMPLGGPTMRFWLDPYWARYYLDEQSERDDCLVFVPYGTALFPAMHDWNVGEMREYLRFAVSRWFGPTAGPMTGQSIDPDADDSLPERAVYLFDGPADLHATIHVSVLDRDGFVPLQQRIGWINTNLEAMRPDPDVDDIIAEIADARTREAVVGTITARADAAEETFDRTVEAANAHVAARLRELLDALNKEMAGLIERAQRTTTDVVRLKNRLRDLDTTRLDMRRLDAEVTGMAQEAGAAADGLNAYYNAQLSKAQQAVLRADTVRVTANKEIAEAATRLKATREHLEKLLDELL